MVHNTCTAGGKNWNERKEWLDHMPQVSKNKKNYLKIFVDDLMGLFVNKTTIINPTHQLTEAWIQDHTRNQREKRPSGLSSARLWALVGIEPSCHPHGLFSQFGQKQSKAGLLCLYGCLHLSPFSWCSWHCPQHTVALAVMNAPLYLGQMWSR